MATRYLLTPLLAGMQEYDIDSYPNWRVQYGKEIYIEITLPKILFVYIFCSFYPGDVGAASGIPVLETRF